MNTADSGAATGPGRMFFQESDRPDITSPLSVDTLVPMVTVRD